MASRAKWQRMPVIEPVGLIETICDELPRKSMHDVCAKGKISLKIGMADARLPSLVLPPSTYMLPPAAVDRARDDKEMSDR
eukprot:4730793-Prymnesium_polylepis.2